MFVYNITYLFLNINYTEINHVVRKTVLALTSVELNSLSKSNKISGWFPLIELDSKFSAVKKSKSTQ